MPIRNWFRRHRRPRSSRLAGRRRVDLDHDAPFRETKEAIEAARQRGILAVEMEAAALYTFATANTVRVLCLAHVTNTMGQTGQDFEKGEADGTADALAVLGAIIRQIPT